MQRPRGSIIYLSLFSCALQSLIGCVATPTDRRACRKVIKLREEALKEASRLGCLLDLRELNGVDSSGGLWTGIWAQTIHNFHLASHTGLQGR